MFPFLVNLLLLGTIPVARVLITLPGTFIGATAAPFISKRLGRQRILLMHGIFLCLSATAMFLLAFASMSNRGYEVQGALIFNVGAPTA